MIALVVALVAAVAAPPDAPAATTPTANSAPNAATTTKKEPAPQDVVFWNARLALRDHRQQDVLRLWLLRNALASADVAPTHDADFRSVVWVALGETGFCTDGFIEDDAGAGLWPLAIHNWLLKNIARQNPSQPAPWPSFEASMQQRWFSLNDTLSLEELKTARFFRADCLVQYRMLPRLPSLHWIDMEDRLSVGIMMRDLIDLAGDTLHTDKVSGTALLATRRFDLEAALTKMTAARVNTDTNLAAQLLRAAGVSEGGTQMLRAQRLGDFRTSSESALWRAALTWPPSEWLSLSRQRRLSLFADATATMTDTDAKGRVILTLIDALLDRGGPGDGAEVESWLGFHDPRAVAALPAAPTTTAAAPTSAAATTTHLDFVAEVALSARGERLLGLEPTTGFRERSAIALHRGVQFLKDGDTLQALRSFAFALAHAEDSRDAEGVHRLAQRWLAFVLSQYQSTDEVLSILERFVPATDFNTVVEVLVWRAAFHADRASFDRVSASVKKAGSLTRTVGQLRPLADGDVGKMWNELIAAAGPEQAGLGRFVERFVEQLSLEPLDVRANNKASLEAALQVIDSLDKTAGSSLKKKLNLVKQRTQALLDGIGQYDDSVRGRVEAGAVDREAYAGSVRLAPADPLPWPFTAPRVTPPNPFAPLILTPEEWRPEGGDLIYGWRLHE